jgi:hypothetical protein
MERQMHLGAYSGVLGICGPVAQAYQMKQLFSVNPRQFRAARNIACRRLFPAQAMMRYGQVNASSIMNDNLNTWCAFGTMGVLQGMIYGHANVGILNQYTKRQTKIHTLRQTLRGSGYAALRDMGSQGIPFVCSGYIHDWVRSSYPSVSQLPTPLTKSIAVMGTSVFSTIITQGLHNCQTVMQTHPNLTHITAPQTLWKQHGISSCWKGVYSRIGLLLIINGLNELLLKPTWISH